ncbi:NADP-dependent oxidoreductase [Streptomyces sp. SL13]|uniref:NADP-dependent oxidoreductase n=1 Tax=Streptantibioticus silvisoli TaxID=2705255 RepID=A0AA90H7E2_9ACTN|nr:NADP-dependent oxidoreductase [Streptantibioticus silvisoli]MDI5972340.1 NADP-dependent oxidoreductase [Streptantibioticus silvisoli]
MPEAYVFTAFGGPEVEGYADLPVAEPGPGQVRIAVRAAGVNPVDWKLRSGMMPAVADGGFPVVFGNEVAGVVEAVGPDTEDFAVGDEVFGNPLTGGYARRTLLSAALTAHKPPELSFTDAAALPVAAATAYDALRQLALPRGSTLVLVGAGGGVGVAAAQIAAHEGIRVVGVASAGKRELVESFGAVHVAHGDGVADRVAAAAPDGVDAVLDLAGGAGLEAVASALPGVRLVTAGDPVTAGRFGGVMVERVRGADALAEVARLAVAGVLSPGVTAVFGLDEAGRALRSVESGHAIGKTVIEVTA